MSIELLATSIADRAYERIRADIVFGRLAPRARLRLDQLTNAYGASVSTLREILSRLSSEGLVIAEGQRGFWVAPVSPAGFEDVAAMRLLLETYALPLSFTAGDLEWESRVVAAHHKLTFMERRMLAGAQEGMELWKRYDREFHQTLIEACGSQTLLDLYTGVFDQYLRYQMVAVVFRGEIAAAEHRTLLDCALTRNAELACAVLTQHVNGCVAYTLESGALT
ncbi:GntR family transcriptional regulator [Microvirga terrestris]|uniref:GntR family transcriptional regulator n=1 Tax=Microvirga terrestris TaxID=2791024 RepID=A0ABS0HWI9_9HYPH|nr:GntR family transcriptional regulator [Microvirga terrestris]MBF9197830.1 GntR family transcriptional regulator [Microvirga terrestris]